MLGEHEVWPAEAETLPQAERETIMAKLWDTLTRKLPWNSREFFVASANAIKARLLAARPTKRRPETSASSSTAASSSKTPRIEEETLQYYNPNTCYRNPT